MRPSRTSLAALALVAACKGPRAPQGTPGCPEDRTVVIAAQDEVARYAACEQLSSLKIRTGGPIDLTPLGALATITGNLSVGPTIGMEELKLTGLEAVEGTIEIQSNNSLRGVFLPRLERAGRIDIEANASLTTVALPRLTEMMMSLVVAQNSQLELLDLSSLVVVQDLIITDNPSLTLIEGGKLTTAHDIRIEGNKNLPQDVVDGVRAKTPTE